MSVKVGVRVRPFNQRENDLNCRLCVEMVGNMTRLIDEQNPDKPRDFTFDYSFWSHDSFEVDEKGYFQGINDKYADQQHVFSQVGEEILTNAWQGYHCCLFAYGQTGAGKSYSMVGYGANKGIVPISCEQIFTRIEKNQDKYKQYEVNISMMEIYNQKVQDLLIPIEKRPREGHKIRQHKTLGIYVEGMSKHFVDTYKAIEKKMEDGGRNRSIAATQMNASSSRAHTIISIEFKQIQVGENNKKKQKLSVIYLVDLAGSQKVGKTGATGDRLKQAAGINKSLSVLGLVISCLADKAMGKGKGSVVPYRDSCLTRILQNALGGNSKTLMICAISPATDNFEETLSTLRYADQAKKIQNKAVVNESETEKLIRTLTAEKQELREKLQKMEEMFKKLTLGVTPQMLQERKNTEAELKYSNEVMNDYQTTKKDKIQKENDYDSFTAIDVTKPRITNLNQDPQLSRKVSYSINNQITKIGKRGMSPPNNIEIGGMSIRQLHAIVTKREEEFYMEPIQPNEDGGCYLNGDLIIKQTRIYHADRISFGTNNMFLVLIPETLTRDQIDQKKIDWQFAQNQLYLKKEQIQKTIREQEQQKIKEQMELVLHEKEAQLVSLMKSLKQSQQLRKQAEESKQSEMVQIQKKVRQEQAMIIEKEKQIERNKRLLKDSESQQKEKSKEKHYLQYRLLKTLPKCIQLNLIAKQFKKDVVMCVKMSINDQDDEDIDIQFKKRVILIKVVNRDVGYSYWWDTQTLTNRYYIIRDMAEQYFQTGQIPIVDNSNDPFWDPEKPTLIGRGFLSVKTLAYILDNPSTLPIIGDDQHCGELVVNLIPTDSTGQRNLCEQMDEQQILIQPQDLIGKELNYLVIIQSGKIAVNFKDIFAEYQVKVTEHQKQKFRTEVITEKTKYPQFNYRHLHKFQTITQNLLLFLTSAKIVFKVYGCQVFEKEVKHTESKIKTLEPTILDVQKAKREDLKKNEGEKTPPLAASPSTSKQNSLPSEKNKKVIAFPDTTPKMTVGKIAGSNVNNKIGQRNRRHAKEKDCQIY